MTAVRQLLAVIALLMPAAPTPPEPLASSAATETDLAEYREGGRTPDDTKASFPVPARGTALSTVSDNLFQAMLKARTTPDKLGAALGHRDGRYIRAILAGDKHPSTAMLTKIAHALSVPVEDLTRLPGPRPPA